MIIPRKKSKSLYIFPECYVIARNREKAMKEREEWLQKKSDTTK